MWEPVVLSRKDTVLSSPTKSFLWSISQWTYSQFQSVSGSDAADLKNNLTQTRSFEFSDSTEIGGIWIPFSPTKSLLWRMFLFSPSGPATNSSQYLALMQLISNNLGSSELSDSTEIGGILIPFLQNIREYFTRGCKIFYPRVQNILPAGAKYSGIFYPQVYNIPEYFTRGCKIFRRISGAHAARTFSCSGVSFSATVVSGSDAADLKNNLTQTRSSEFSDSTEIHVGLILIPFPPTKSLLWRMFLFSPSGPATTILANNSQFQSISGSDAADLKNNLTQTRSSEFSNSTENNRWNIDTIFPYMCFKQLIFKIISHKVGTLRCRHYRINDNTA